MNRKMILLKGFIFLCLCVFSATTIWAQDFCEGNFDYDLDVDGGDAALFKLNFGRSPFKNPCPTDGPSLVPKTGQVRCYSWEGNQIDCTSGQDGYLQKGVEWPDSRLTDNSDGTVTDYLTGLMWLKDATCMKTHYLSFDNDGDSGEDGRVTWQHALDFVEGINAGAFSLCGAGHIDWRLPNVRELFSLIDFNSYPVVPLIPVFDNVLEGTQDSYFWWTSTTEVTNTVAAFAVSIGDAKILSFSKVGSYHVWPVRGGR